MLRIFGFYQFSGSDNSSAGKSIVKEMSCFSGAKSQLTRCKAFDFKNIFLVYESLQLEEASRYSFVSKNKKQACFVIGNIFAYEEFKLEILSTKNLAEFVFAEYQKRGFSFLQYLRGEFNIILIDEGKLFLINDKLGLSSLYIYRVKDGIFFCSEAGSIIWLGRGNRLDYASIAEFLVYGFIPDGKTFVKDLYNQAPGTVIAVSHKKCVQKEYSSLERFPKINDLPLKKRVEFVNDLFSEAVEIRTPVKGPIAQELTGGWDTRFVLAALLSSGKSPLTITANISRNDLLLAKHLAKKFRVRHYAVDDRRDNLDRAFDYKFRLHKKSFFVGSRNISLLSENIKDSELREILSLKKFTGLFGSEIFGFMSETFFEVFMKDFFAEAKLKFSDSFLNRIKTAKQLKYEDAGASNNIAYLFLTQFVRSYWNVYMNMQRDRIFDFFSLHPFVDSKIVSAMSSLDYKKNMNYKLYTAMFKQYHQEFLKEPYTFEYFRKPNGCRDLWDIEFEKEKREFRKRVLSDLNFLRFLTDKRIMREKKLAHEDLKRLYCLFSWLNTYRPVLKHKADLLF